MTDLETICLLFAATNRAEKSFAMKTSLLNLAFACTALAATNLTLPNGWFIIPPSTQISQGDFYGHPRYLTWMSDTQIKHGIGPTHAYDVSALLSGVKLAYDRTHDDKYAAYIQKHADIVLYPGFNGDILLYNNSNSIDDIRFGHTFLDMYNISGGNNVYKTAAQTLRNQIDRTGRTPDGGFYHRYPGYIDQVCGCRYRRSNIDSMPTDRHATDVARRHLHARRLLRALDV